MKPLAAASVAKRSRTRQPRLDGELWTSRLIMDVRRLEAVVDRWSMAIVAALWLPSEPLEILFSGMALDGMDDVFTALFMGSAFTMTYDGVVSRA